MDTEYRYIATFNELQRWCNNIMSQRHDVLALDTEFMREKTYFPQLCLIQLATRTEIVLVDPLECVDLSPLVELWTSPSLIKLIHSAAQDIEVLHQHLQALPSAMVDTQLAYKVWQGNCIKLTPTEETTAKPLLDAAILQDENASEVTLTTLISYQDLVRKVFNVEISKNQTRTNWQQRPLSDAQIHYAKEDVYYLIALYDHFRAVFSDKDWQSLYDEQRYLLEPVRYESNLAQAWKKVKSRQRLKGVALTHLKRLAALREQLAMEHNLPRRWILSDNNLVNLCVCPQHKLNEFSIDIRELSQSALKYQSVFLPHFIQFKQQN